MADHPTTESMYNTHLLIPPPLLPPEIVDIALDHLHDHRPSLQSCSLVCRDWLNTARYHLFREFVVACTSESAMGGNLEDYNVSVFLDRCSAVLPYIQTLHVKPSTSPILSHISVDVLDIRALIEILISLPSLREVYLQSLALHRAPFESGLPPNARPLKLRRLTFRDVNVGPHAWIVFMGMILSIETLCLLGRIRMVQQIAELHSSDGYPFPTLRHLLIQDFDTGYRDSIAHHLPYRQIASSHALSTLRIQLSITPSGASTNTGLASMMAEIGESLKTLEVDYIMCDIPRTHQVISQSLDLVRCPKLEYLSISFLIDTDAFDEEEIHLNWTTATLIAASAIRPLRQVTFVLYVPRENGKMERGDELNQEDIAVVDWKSIDERLVHIVGSPLVLILAEDEAWGEQRFEPTRRSLTARSQALLRANLPELDAMGRLRF